MDVPRVEADLRPASTRENKKTKISALKHKGYLVLGVARGTFSDRMSGALL